MMRKLYKTLLGLDDAWMVGEVIVVDSREEITVYVSYSVKEGDHRCPKCKNKARYHDTQERQIAYFDTCGYKTWIELKYARVICPLCGMMETEPEFVKKVKKETPESAE